MHIKVRSIIITLLFLFVAYTPAHATIYLNLNAEDGTVGTYVPNPPFCQTPCSGGGERATYQSSGGTPQGSNYYQWHTVDNQPQHYTEISIPGGAITNIIGNTYYLAYYFRFDRINGQDIWHEFKNDSYDKVTDIIGSGVRWTFMVGQHICYAQNQDHRFSAWLSNPTYHLNPNLECSDQYIQNSNGYSKANPIQLPYEIWHSVVIAIKMATDNTGSVSEYIDGIKILEYTNIRTALNSSSTIGYLYMGGTIAQHVLDAPAHYRKFDAILFTDNWQDIIDGGYLSSDTPPPSDGGNTLPPSSSSTGGDSSSSGGSGCGFVKEDGKGQRAEGEGLIFAIMLIITLAGIAVARRAKDLF